MTFILIDRRKAVKGKSTNNRQKLIKRVKNFIKISVPQNIGQGGVTGANSKGASPVKVTGNALEEPWMCYTQSGESTEILIGNDKYDRGDEIKSEGEGQGQGAGQGAGQGDGGEDDFIVNVARDEFLDLFFEDCELPNLTHEKFTEKLDNKFQQAGFSTTGNPSQLSIIRSFKQSLGRRWALMKPHKEEREELDAELEQIEKDLANNVITAEADVRRKQILARLEEIGNKLMFLDGFDKVDLRYRKKEARPLKTVESVLIMMMDVSGSMGQEEKTIARRWFALLYAFIKRRYGNTDLVFIAHTDEAFEMSEEDFFSTKINGGTSVSPALDMANKIILERYDPNQTNIYVSHASDGDNWDNDAQKVMEQMLGTTGLSSKIQMFSYAEVGGRASNAYGWMGSSGHTSLWSAYENCKKQMPQGKMSMVQIKDADSCYAAFKQVFGKKVSF